MDHFGKDEGGALLRKGAIVLVALALLATLPSAAIEEHLDAGPTQAISPFSGVAWHTDSSSALVVGRSYNTFNYSVGTLWNFAGGTTGAVTKAPLPNAFENQATVNDVAIHSGKNGDQVLMAAELGQILRHDGTKWTLISVGTNHPFYGVAFNDAGTKSLAVGGWAPSDTALLYSVGADSATIITLPSTISGPLYDVAFLPGSDLAVAVGANGLVLLVNGTTVTPIAAGTDLDIHAIAFAPNGTIGLAVGDSGSVAEFSQLGPKLRVDKVVSGVSADLRDVAFLPQQSDGYALIVGDSGTILKWVDHAFHPQALPAGAATNVTLTGVAFRPDGAQATFVGEVPGALTGVVHTLFVNRPPPSVDALRAVAASTSLTIRWNASVISDFSRYEVYHSAVGPFVGINASNVATITDRTTTETVVEDLIQATPHWVRVVVYDDGDPTLSAQTSLLVVKTTNAAPAPVAINQVADVTDVSLRIHWSENLDHDFAAYEARYDTSPLQGPTNGTLLATITDRSLTSVRLSGLTERTTYYLGIVVIDNGTPPLRTLSASFDSTTLNGVPPAVELTRVVAPDATSVVVHWNTSDIDDFKEYQIHRHKSLADFTPDSSTLVKVVKEQDANVTTIHGHKELSTYHYRIVIVDEGGLSNTSSGIKVKTPISAFSAAFPYLVVVILVVVIVVVLGLLGKIPILGSRGRKGSPPAPPQPMPLPTGAPAHGGPGAPPMQHPPGQAPPPGHDPAAPPPHQQPPLGGPSAPPNPDPWPPMHGPPQAHGGPPPMQGPPHVHQHPPHGAEPHVHGSGHPPFVTGSPGHAGSTAPLDPHHGQPSGDHSTHHPPTPGPIGPHPQPQPSPWGGPPQPQSPGAAPPQASPPAQPPAGAPPEGFTEVPQPPRPI